jgi:hypothetical protein
MLTTEDVLYDAVEAGIIKDGEAAEYIRYAQCYPLNWVSYVPTALSKLNSLRFLLGLMRYHMLDDDDPFEVCMRQVMYLPKTGEQYKIMLSNINACNNQSRPFDSVSSFSADYESTDDCSNYFCSLAWPYISVSKLTLLKKSLT